MSQAIIHTFSLENKKESPKKTKERWFWFFNLSTEAIASWVKTDIANMKLPLSPAGTQRAIPRSAEKPFWLLSARDNQLNKDGDRRYFLILFYCKSNLSVLLVFSECSLQCFVLYSLWCYIWCSLYSLVFSLVFYPRCWCSLWFPLLCSTSEVKIYTWGRYMWVGLSSRYFHLHLECRIIGTIWHRR